MAEPDFESNHLTMLAMIHGYKIPEDPYELVARETRLDRKTVKMVFVRLMGADGAQSYNQMKHMLATDKASRIERSKVDEIRSAFNKHVGFLKSEDLLCTGWGNKMQYLEGQIATKMFQWATEQKIPILNVHDAYGCKKEHEAQVLNAMISCREKVIEEYMQRT